MFVEHKEAVEITEAPAKALTLSEAIRIGARIRPQNRNGFYFAAGASCAIGAAWEGMGLGYGHELSVAPSRLEERLGVHLPCAIWHQIYEMNDKSHTREQIADLLQERGY